jgi:hypothetical protein
MVIFRVSFLCVVVVVVRVLDDVALGLGRRSAAWRVGALCLDLDHLVVVVAHFGLGLIARVLALGLASAPRACSSLGPLLGTSRQYGGCSHETMRASSPHHLLASFAKACACECNKRQRQAAPVSASVATGKRTGERVPLGPFFSSSSESPSSSAALESLPSRYLACGNAQRQQQTADRV